MGVPGSLEVPMSYRTLPGEGRRVKLVERQAPSLLLEDAALCGLEASSREEHTGWESTLRYTKLVNKGEL